MARRSTVEVPADIRARLEAARLDLLALFRALDQLPDASARLRKNLPQRAHPTLAQQEVTVRRELDPAEAYNMIPGRDPQTG